MKRSRDRSGDAAVLALKPREGFQGRRIADHARDLPAAGDVFRLPLGGGFGGGHGRRGHPLHAGQDREAPGRPVVAGAGGGGRGRQETMAAVRTGIPVRESGAGGSQAGGLHTIGPTGHVAACTGLSGPAGRAATRLAPEGRQRRGDAGGRATAAWARRWQSDRPPLPGEAGTGQTSEVMRGG